MYIIDLHLSVAARWGGQASLFVTTAVYRYAVLLSCMEIEKWPEDRKCSDYKNVGVDTVIDVNFSPLFVSNTTYLFVTASTTKDELNFSKYLFRCLVQHLLVYACFVRSYPKKTSN